MKSSLISNFILLTISETEYKLTFYTSDQKDAGTTGEVYVKLYGEKDSSREIWVNSIQQTNRGQSTSYHFTRGSTVEVYLPPCPQLGEITKLKVGHNGAGSSPSWFLNKVRCCTSYGSIIYLIVPKQTIDV